MKYEKPELVLLGTALAEVCNPTDKSEQDVSDGPFTLSSINAYAADE